MPIALYLSLGLPLAQNCASGRACRLHGVATQEAYITRCRKHQERGGNGNRGRVEPILFISFLQVFYFVLLFVNFFVSSLYDKPIRVRYRRFWRGI